MLEFISANFLSYIIIIFLLMVLSRFCAPGMNRVFYDDSLKIIFYTFFIIRNIFIAMIFVGIGVLFFVDFLIALLMLLIYAYFIKSNILPFFGLRY